MPNNKERLTKHRTETIRIKMTEHQKGQFAYQTNENHHSNSTKHAQTHIGVVRCFAVINERWLPPGVAIFSLIYSQAKARRARK